VSAARWKRQERAVAAALGTRRLPNNGQGQPDIRAPGWALQVKTRKKLPAWLTEAMTQAARDAGPAERAAVVLAEVSQGRKARRLVVLTFEDWCALVVPGKSTGGHHDNGAGPRGDTGGTGAVEGGG
jgi:hypothetical protein